MLYAVQARNAEVGDRVFLGTRTGQITDKAHVEVEHLRERGDETVIDEIIEYVDFVLTFRGSTTTELLRAEPVATLVVDR